MIPFGLLGGFCDHLEIRITGLSEEGFSFRVPEKIEKAACLEICFFDFSADCYRKVQLAEKEREMKLTEETPFFFIYSVWTKNGEYREQVKRLVTDYDNYISLKLAGDDAYLSEKMVGYPAELDEVYAESFEEQKKEWFSGGGDGRKDCFCEKKGKEEIWKKQSSSDDFEEGLEFELALTIDRPELYNDFLQKDGTTFCHDYWKNNFLEHHPLSQKQATRLYIGNQFCHNLFPEKKQLFQMLEKAFENKLAVTIAFTYVRDNLLEETEKLLQELQVWCQGKEQEGLKAALRAECQIQVKTNGTLRPAGNTLQINEGTEATLYISAATNYVNYQDVSADESHRTSEYLKRAMQIPYEKALKNHIAYYKKQFDRVRLTLPAGKASQLETPKRIENFGNGEDMAMAALLFHYGRYLLISSSQPGGQPANLQGIWNNSTHAPWDSKYTININTEMNYWPAEVTNLSETHSPLDRKSVV